MEDLISGLKYIGGLALGFLIWYGIFYFFIEVVNPMDWSFWQKFWFLLICFFTITND